MEKIKENGVLIGVAAFVVIIIGFIFISSTRNSSPRKKVIETKTEETGTRNSTFVGSVMYAGEKEPFLVYSFVLPEAATSTVSDGGAYIETTLAEESFTKIFISDERERAQSAEDYLKNVIAPQVNGFELGDIVMFGEGKWQTAESASMKWYVMSALSGKSLVMVESYKKDKDAVEAMLASMKVTTK